MTSQILNLPINIPWCQIAVTDNMMDTRSGDRRFPPPWRSSIAISAYEPSVEDLPKEFSDKRITYLKVTCTITGYQPTRAETERGYADLDDGSTTFRLIFEDYMSCYGVLLNVAVFPATMRLGQLEVGGDDLTKYPHIIAFEPKSRDLYQAATETGEVLTASNSRLSTDKTFSHTETSETGLSLSGSYGSETSKVSAGMTHNWGSTDQDRVTIQTDASRDRRENEGSTTQISQMYNLLTGFHQGTNRATFLMLPRPHVLQPTDRRTFVQGLRVIEGIQEFMLIIERPAEIPILCVEAFLETGHFSEDAGIIRPKENYDEDHIDYIVTTSAEGSGLLTIGEECKRIEEDPSAVRSLPLGWVEDTRPERRRQTNAPVGSGWDNGHPGVAEIVTDGTSVSGHNYKVEDSVFTVSGKICGENSIFGGSSANFNRTYRVFLRSEDPIPDSEEAKASILDLLITSRGLDVCFKPGDGCPEVVRDRRVPIDDSEVIDTVAMYRESIVDERKIRINPSLLTYRATTESRTSTAKELLREIQNAMTSSGRLPTRYPLGEVGFLESDYFKNRVREILPHERMETPLSRINGLPDEVVRNLGDQSTVGAALKMTLSDFARKTGLSIDKATNVRRALLGIRREVSDDATSDPEHGYDKSVE